MGDISKNEIDEINSVFSIFKTGNCYSKSVKEPAGIFVWRAALIGAAWTACSGLAVYAKFIKGYNILWFAGAYVPLWSLLLYNYARQPHQQTENIYKYLLAKRAATCEYEKN